MIRVLSDKITEFLFQQGKITAEVKELCRYGLMLVNGNGVAMHGFHAHLHSHPQLCWWVSCTDARSMLPIFYPYCYCVPLGAEIYGTGFLGVSVHYGCILWYNFLCCSIGKQ